MSEKAFDWLTDYSKSDALFTRKASKKYTLSL